MLELLLKSTLSVLVPTVTARLLTEDLKVVMNAQPVISALEETELLNNVQQVHTDLQPEAKNQVTVYNAMMVVLQAILEVMSVFCADVVPNTMKTILSVSVSELSVPGNQV